MYLLCKKEQASLMWEKFFCKSILTYTYKGVLRKRNIIWIRYKGFYKITKVRIVHNCSISVDLWLDSWFALLVLSQTMRKKQMLFIINLHWVGKGGRAKINMYDILVSRLRAEMWEQEKKKHHGCSEVSYRGMLLQIFSIDKNN